MKFDIWYDRKRGCLVSNIGFALGKRLGISANAAAVLMAEFLREHHGEKIESVWVS